MPIFVHLKLKHVLAIAVTLCLAAFVASYSATAYAQTPSPTPSPHDALITEIKDYAQRHVKAGSQMQSEAVTRYFLTNTVGLTPAEISKIYEEEYLRSREAQKPSFWDTISPNLGWVTAFLVLLIVVLHDFLKKRLDALLNWLENMLVTNFSGTRLFRRMALGKYREALIELYKDLKIPFRPNHPIPLSEIFVPMSLKERPDGEPIDANQKLFTCKRLMIKGEPGSGKSTFLRHLALSYARIGLNQLPEQPVPVLIELHRFNDPEVKIMQELIAEFKRRHFKLAERFLERNLNLGTLMLLFDGLDEVSGVQRSNVAQQIEDLLTRYDKCRVVITCRSAVYRNEFHEVVDETLELAPLTDQQIYRFLRPWAKSMPEHKSVDQLMKTLHDTPKMMELARNPLLLTIIAYLYTDIPDYILPQSRSAFYRRSTTILLDQWHENQNKYPTNSKTHILRRLASIIQDRAMQNRDDSRTLDHATVMAEVGKLRADLNIAEDDKPTAVIKEIVERSGLLLSVDNGERYQFAHLTLQEYYAAEAFLDKQADMLSRYMQHPDTWRETVKLWCGLASESTSMIQELFKLDPILALECLADTQKVDTAEADKILRHFMARLGDGSGDSGAIERALGAVASDPGARGSTIYNFLKSSLDVGKSPQIRTSVANALAFTNQRRSAELLAKNYFSIEETRAPLARMGDLAVPSLVTLVSEGIDLLGANHEEYGSNDEASQLIYHQSFDILPENIRVILAKYIQPLDDLGQIGTPQAVQALVPLLWIPLSTTLTPHMSTRYLVMHNAAWRLAGLMVRRGTNGLLEVNIEVQNTLREYPLSEAQRKETGYDWVWEPFSNTEPTGSSIPIITGRIASLLAVNFPLVPPSTQLTLDPRLTIPLLTIELPPKETLARLQTYLDEQMQELLRWVSSVSRLVAWVTIQNSEVLKERLSRGVIRGFPPPTTIQTSINAQKAHGLPQVKSTLASFYDPLSTVEQPSAPEWESLRDLPQEALRVIEPSATFRDLFASLPYGGQMVVLAALFTSRLPIRNDWKHLLKPDNFTFVSSWHFRGVLLIGWVASLSALYYFGSAFWNAWRLGTLLTWDYLLFFVVSLLYLVSLIPCVLFFMSMPSADDPARLLGFYLTARAFRDRSFMPSLKHEFVMSLFVRIVLIACVIWLPTTIIAVTLLLLAYLPWSVIAALWLVAGFMWIALWKIGKSREIASQNPLLGILDGFDPTTATSK